MSNPDPLRWWDPRHPMDAMTAVWSAAENLPLRPGTGAAYQTLFLALRRVALGRTFTTEVAGDRLQVTVGEIVSLLDPLRLIKGRLGEDLAVEQGAAAARQCPQAIEPPSARRRWMRRSRC